MDLNLDTLEDNLRELFVKACELSLECQQYILEAGADILPHETVITPDSMLWHNFLVDGEYITWLFPEDSGGMDLEMPVPKAVLKGDMTVKDWAQQRIDDWNEALNDIDGSMYDEQLEGDFE